MKSIQDHIVLMLNFIQNFYSFLQARPLFLSCTAPKGVYPSQISPLTRSPGNVINFEWIGYDTTPVSYSHLPTGGSFPDPLPINFLNLTWSPPCISPATMNAINFTLTPSVPRRALIGLNPAQVESDGVFSIHWSGGERSSVQLISKLVFLIYFTHIFLFNL